MASLGKNDQTKDGISSKQIEHADLQETVPFSHQEEKALVRKIDLALLPVIWFMYLLSYMDRTKYVACTQFHDELATNDSCNSIGNAKISGMETDLNLTSNQYSTALVVFFVGYVVFEVPSK
jgi:hypothetical protein